MGFFRSLFGPPKPKLTPLIRFIHSCTPQDVVAIVDSIGDDKEKLSIAISMAVLNGIRIFSEQLHFHQNTMYLVHNKRVPINYDVVTYETAAYTHYLLFNYYRGASTLESQSLDQIISMNRNDFNLLYSATITTNNMIRKYNTFRLPEEAFLNRIMTYDKMSNGSDSILLFGFQNIIHMSIELRRPFNAFLDRKIISATVNPSLQRVIVSTISDSVAFAATQESCSEILSIFNG